MLLVLLLLTASCVKTQIQENTSSLNVHNTQQPLPNNNQNETVHRASPKVPNDNFDIKYNSSQSFYQTNFQSNAYCDNNEADQQKPFSHDLDRCPDSWIRFQSSCYRFTKLSGRSRNEARKICQAYEADLAAVNNFEEHAFILTNLEKLDSQQGSWYIGAHQDNQSYWTNDADGTQMSGLENVFLENTSFNSSQSFLVYRFSKQKGKWVLAAVEGNDNYNFICQGQIQRLRYLTEDKSFTYGLETFNPDQIPRGPYFIKEPVDTIYHYDPMNNDRVQLNCIAGGYPVPVYKWYREDYVMDRPIFTELDPLVDTRVVISGGTLVIFYPDKDKDNTTFHCTASNEFGTIRSESVRLLFGYIRKFSQKRSNESGKQYWGKVLSCNPPAYFPAVSFLWVRDYYPNILDENERIFVSHDGNIYFSSLEIDDGGKYSCNVISTDEKQWRDSPYFSLDVYPHVDYQPLEFLNDFPKIFPESAVVGQEVRLECFSFGRPAPLYSWTRKNGDIPKSAYMSEYNRVLTIPNVAIEDEGEYICNVCNETTQFSKSVFVKLQAEPNFTVPLADRHMDAKEELHWYCIAFGIPSVNYTWWKNAQKLTMDTLDPEDRDRYVIKDNVLIIKHLDPVRDPGMYQCKAKNQLKASYSSGQLRVLALKPSFRKRPLEPETYGSEGGNVTLKCNPEAAPKPTYTWKKENITIRASGKRFITESGNLIIRQLSRDDEGVYTCVAENEYGTDKSEGRLIVLRTPRFLEQLPPHITAQVNQVVYLRCIVEIDPVLDTAYLWYHNSIRMKDASDLYADRRIKIEGGELTIVNVSISDAGDYVCVVKSALGCISSHAHLRIEGPPGAPGGLRILNIRLSSVTLEWTDSEVYGHPITSYIITGRSKWNSTWNVISDNVTKVMDIDKFNRRKRANVTAIFKPWTIYEFRVQSVNVLGVGKPSAPGPQISTPSDKPYQAPANIGGGSGTIGDLTITWTPLPSSLQNGPGIHYKIFWRRNGSGEEFQSLTIKKYGNIGTYVVPIPAAYFFTLYDVKVQAINDVGAGPESDVITIFSAEGLPLVYPDMVSARSFNSTAINVTWNPIDQLRETMRGKLIGYRLKYWKRENEEEDCKYYASRTTRNWALIVDLQPDTFYFIKVMAYNSAGTGPESEPCLQHTLRKAPQNRPYYIKVSIYNSNTVRVRWRYRQSTEEEEPLLGYKVIVWEDNQDMSTGNIITVPVDQNASNVNNITVFAEQKTSTAKNITVTADRKTSTANNIIVPADQNTSTANDITVPAVQNMSTANNTSMPKDHKKSTANNITVPTDQKMSTANNITVPADQKTSTAHDINVPAIQNMSIANNITVPADHKMRTANNITVPADQKMSTANNITMSADKKTNTANNILAAVNRDLVAYITNLDSGKIYHLRVCAYSNGGNGRMSSPVMTFRMEDKHPDF